MFDTLSDKFANAFKTLQGKSTISEENIEETLKEVRTALLEADVNFKVVKEFVAAVKEKAVGEKVIKGVNPGEQFVKIVHDELARVMARVTYWEPAKWVLKLRDFKSDSKPIVFKVNMGAGHFGDSGRYQALKEYAEEFSYIFKLTDESLKKLKKIKKSK